MSPVGERVCAPSWRQFAEHYRAERSHQGPGNVIPFPSRDPASPAVRLGRRKRLGGVLSFTSESPREPVDRELGALRPLPGQSVAVARDTKGRLVVRPDPDKDIGR